MKIGPALLGVIAGARRGTASGPISYVTGADSDNDATLIIPAHAANDLIIAWAHGNGVGTPPDLPSGWANILNSGARTASASTRLYCIRDAGNTVNSLALPANTADVGFMIYRNASGAGVSSMGAEDTSGDTSGTTPSLGALTAGSWVIAGLDLNQGDDTIADPGALTARIGRLAIFGGGTGSVVDTGGVVASYAGGDSFTWTTPAVWATFAFEILNG